MEKKKFYNETFDTTLRVIVYDQSDKKQCDKLDAYLIKKGLDKSKSYDNIMNSKGFCINFHGFILICFDVHPFNKIEGKGSESHLTISHECGHFRGFVLENIRERITSTDSEVYSRISDWAFRKCMTMKYFKGLLKKK